MARTRTRRRVLARDRIRWSFAAYPLTLVVLAVGAFRLPGRTWGIEAWAWIPPAWAVGLAALGVAAGLVARRTGSRDPEAFPRLPRALTLVALLGLAASFWFLRTRAHFLGDGYQNLGILAADHVRVKDTARGTLWILIRLKELFGGGEAGALAAYRALALVSGAAWLAVVAAGARRVVDGAGARSFAAVVMLSGPALLFFGYVENYAPFALAVTAFTFTGLHVARTGRGRWLMPGLAGIAILLHVLGFTLLPALLWALVAGTPAGDFLARLPASRRWTGVIGLALVAALFGVPAWRDSLTLQFALVPLPGSPYAVEGYTLFSVAHLADLANLAFLLVPGGALLAAAAAAARGRTGRRPAEAGFLAVLIASTSGAVFLLDPRLGMPRDWDVFAFAGIPWAVALGWAWSRAAAVEPRLRLLGPLAALLGILVLLPRLLVLSDPETAVRQFESYLDLDFRKGRNGRLLLVNHYRETGRDALAEAELESWNRDYPERRAVLEGIRARRSGDLDAAVGWNRLAIEENPQYFDAYNNLAHCLLDLGRPEEAIPLLEVALAINPDEVGVLTNLGTAEAMRGNVDAARHRWRRALAMDPAAFHPNKNLAILARESGDGAGYQHHLERAATAPDATGDVLAEWGDLLAQQGRPDEAAAAWTEAVRRGVGPEREADLRARTAP